MRDCALVWQVIVVMTWVLVQRLHRRRPSVLVWFLDQVVSEIATSTELVRDEIFVRQPALDFFGGAVTLVHKFSLKKLHSFCEQRLKIGRRS